MLRERKMNVRYKHIERCFHKLKVSIFNLIAAWPDSLIYVIIKCEFSIRILCVRRSLQATWLQRHLPMREQDIVTRRDNRLT